MMMMIRFTAATAVSACLCMGPLLTPTLPGLSGGGLRTSAGLAFPAPPPLASGLVAQVGASALETRDFDTDEVTAAAVARRQAAVNDADERAAAVAGALRLREADEQLATATQQMKLEARRVRAAVAAETLAMTAYTAEVAAAGSTGCSNSVASDAAAGSELRAVTAAIYELGAAADDLAGAATAVTDMTGTVRASEVSLDVVDEAAGAEASAARDSATANRDSADVYAGADQLRQLPYC